MSNEFGKTGGLRKLMIVGSGRYEDRAFLPAGSVVTFVPGFACEALSIMLSL